LRSHAVQIGGIGGILLLDDVTLTLVEQDLDKLIQALIDGEFAENRWRTILQFQKVEVADLGAKEQFV